jgi:hypothetical protein
MTLFSSIAAGVDFRFFSDWSWRLWGTDLGPFSSTSVTVSNDNGDSITLGGYGFTFTGADETLDVTGGFVTSISINDNSDTTTEFRFTNIDSVPILDLRTGLSYDIFSGHDIFNLTSANQTIMRGDGLTVNGFAIGGNDTFNTFVAGSGLVTLIGDFDAIYGAAYGGIDYFTLFGEIQSGAIYGDAGIIREGGILYGGNDYIEVYHTENFSIAGDANTVQGTLIGGNDLIITHGLGKVEVRGDASGSGSSSYVLGGSDTIYTGDGNDRIVGDISRIDTNGILIAGGETMHAGSGHDVVYGDVILIC